MKQVRETPGGLYIMRVAAMLTGMHPQTLRKYEREGLLEPVRNKKMRMYSDEDIARLKVIKHLVEDENLNIAGVRIALQLQETLLEIKKRLTATEGAAGRVEQVLKLLDKGLAILESSRS